jgi:hypothetical protein
MYINFKLLNKKGLSPVDLIILQLAKQNKNEDLEADLSLQDVNRIDILEGFGFVDYIKGDKKQSKLSKLRLTKSGGNLLDDLETPEILPEDILLFDWISDVYMQLGKQIGNKKKTKMYIALFRVHSGIEKNHLAALLEKFVKDESNMEFNFRLEYAFFKPTNVFQVKFELDQSRLYMYYLKNKRVFDQIFEQVQAETA